MTRLDELNAYLSSHKERLALPDFRSHIDRSGSNLAWFRKMQKKMDLSDRARELIGMQMKELLGE